MADKIKLVQGDTRPQISTTLVDENTALPIVLTGAAVVMRFRKVGDTTILDTLNSVVTDALNGIVVFSLNPGTLTNAIGDYEGEIEVTFPDATRQTTYDVLKFKVRADF